MKALWLASWYPNKQDKWNGDFIQRHAHAVALHCDVHVINVEPANLELAAATDVTIKKGNPAEVMVLFKNQGKLLNNYTYIKLFTTQVKKYIHENGLPDIVHVHVPFKAGLIALWIKKMYKIPYVITEHWAIYNKAAPDNYHTRSLAFKFLVKQIFLQAAAFFPVSNELGKAVNTLVAKTKFTAIPNVVDTSLFNYKPAEKQQGFSFIHVSTLKEQKNPKGIINCFARFNTLHPSTRLIMVGNCTEEIMQHAAQTGLHESKIVFKGEVSYHEVAVAMQQAHAFMFFSNYENMPCVLLEALCCGLPVVATDVGGVNEIINNANGLLVKPGNETQLLEAMLTMYHTYKTYNCRLIADDATAKYNYDAVGRQYVHQYQLNRRIVVRNNKEQHA